MPFSIKYKEVSGLKSAETNEYDGERIMIFNNKVPAHIFNKDDIQHPTIVFEYLLKKHSINQMEPGWEEKVEDAYIEMMMDLYLETKSNLMDRRKEREERLRIEAEALDRQLRAQQLQAERQMKSQIDFYTKKQEEIVNELPPETEAKVEITIKKKASKRKKKAEKEDELELELDSAEDLDETPEITEDSEEKGEPTDQ